MLLNFSVENHLSFRDFVTFDLEATKDPSREEFSVLERDGERVLAVASVYGANASGKSNLLKAMHFMREAVLGSIFSNLKSPEIPVSPFLLCEGFESKPGFFEITFLSGGYRYRYGFEVTRDRIVSEYLFRKRQGAKEATLFTREEQGITVNPKFFKQGKGLEKRTKETSLFLTVCAAFNVAEAENIMGWFRKFRFISGLDDAGFFGFTAAELQNEARREQLLKFARKADFNICGIRSRIDTIPEADDQDGGPQSLLASIIAKDAKIQTSHTVFDKAGEVVGEVEWDLKEMESEGTKKFIALAGPILHTLQEGSILMIDEFEARLHPALTSAILDWFQSPANQQQSQLIITTHDVNLMSPDHLRRDQIWLVEKSSTGHSDLNRLSDFDTNQVKPTTRFNKHYMMGLYGAYPKVAIDEFRPTPVAVTLS